MGIESDLLLRVLLRERAKLLAYISSILRQRELVEDVFQEISLLALNKRDEIDGEAHLLPWLRTAARFKALRVLERQPRSVSLDEDVLEKLEGAWARTDPVPASDMMDALRGCLQKLTPKARRLVALRYDSGLSGAEVAERLQQPIRSIYTLLSRVHGTLGECIRRTLHNEGSTVSS